MHRRRKSKLDPFLDRIGVLPDREVAALAGVTTENVRAWRKRRSIPAGWRDEPVVPSAPQASADRTSDPGRGGRRPPVLGALTASAWIVTVERGGCAEEWVVLASDIAEAADRAMERLGKYDSGRILSLSFLADALLA